MERNGNEKLQGTISKEDLNANKGPFLTKRLTHITGTFVTDAMPSFLNGAGIAKYKEDKNLTILKTFADGTGEGGAEQDGPRKIKNYRTVFVSSQSGRRMVRDTLTEETGWKPSLMRPYEQNKDGHTSKAGTALDPVAYAEDDIFGYMFTIEGSSKPVISAITATTKAGGTEMVMETVTETDESNGEASAEATTHPSARVRSISRTSPLSTSIWVGLRKDGWPGTDQAYVHLKEGTPLPYDTQFANTPFTGIFTLNFSRLCKFTNIGDRIELSEDLIKKYLDSGIIVEVSDEIPEYYGLETKINDVVVTKGKKIGQIEKRKIFIPKKQHGNVYELANAGQIRKERATAVIKALAVLRGGAKQAAFETDVSPKILIMAGLTCGNPIFNIIFEDDNSGNTRGKTVTINVKALKEIVSDYKLRICTPVYVGIRTGFLKNEEEVRRELKREDGFIITTPIDAARQLTESLPDGAS